MRELFKRYCDLMQEYHREYQSFNIQKAFAIWDEIEEIGKQIVEKAKPVGTDFQHKCK